MADKRRPSTGRLVTFPSLEESLMSNTFFVPPDSRARQKQLKDQQAEAKQKRPQAKERPKTEAS